MQIKSSSAIYSTKHKAKVQIKIASPKTRYLYFGGADGTRTRDLLRDRQAF